MTLWITGMAGFIGQAVAREAVRQGRAVAGLDFGAAGGDGRIVAGAVDRAGLAALLRQAGPPGGIVHAAGSGSVGVSLARPALDFDSNVATTQNLCEFLRENGIDAPLVLVSSAAVYGNGHAGAIGETAPAAPLSPYGFNKYAAELIMRSYAGNFGQRTTLVRLFSVYGEGLRKQILWDLCGRLARDGRAELSGDGSERRDFIHADDAAKALLLALDQAAATAPVLNAGTGNATTMRALADAVCDAWRSTQGRAVAVSFSGLVRQGDPAALVGDVSALKALGFSPAIGLADGLVRYVSWFAQTGAPPA
jgi:UDP-glucose 4-epimerase